MGQGNKARVSQQLQRPVAWIWSSIFLFCFALAAYAIRKDDRATLDQAAVQRGFGVLPLYFELNHGQTDPEVKFLARGRGHMVFLTPEETVLALRKPRPGLQKFLHSRRSAAQ